MTDQLSLLDTTAKRAATGDGIPEGNDAVISADGLYRYVLTRRWFDDLPRAVFLLSNPSKASAVKEDPTTKKTRGFTSRILRNVWWSPGTLAKGPQKMGDPVYGGYMIVNPYAWRATDPQDLIKAHKAGKDVVGPDNMAWIERVFAASLGNVFVGWGTRMGPRPLVIGNVIELAKKMGIDLYSFGENDDGSPRHPLMTPYATPMKVWDPSRWVGEALESS